MVVLGGTFHLLLFVILFVIATSYLRPVDFEGNDELPTETELLSIVGKGMRKLVGSNCLLIERGTFPPFYQCIGCVIEEAQACIDDLRNNLSSNVNPNCQMSTIFSTSQNTVASACCPYVGPTATSSNDLVYMGAAYPMALQCITSVGCGSSTIYKQLLKECVSICPGSDPRSSSQASICLAQFNSANSSKSLALVLTLLIVLVTALLMS